MFVFGVLPAWQVSRGNLADFLKEGGRGTGSAQQHRLQDALVVLQVAVALVLLTGAGLLVESFVRFEQMDPGLSRGRCADGARSPCPTHGIRRPSARTFLTSLPEQLVAQPGVEAASVSGWLPGRGGRGMQPFTIVGDPAPDPAIRRLPCASAQPRLFPHDGDQVTARARRAPERRQRTVKITVVDELLAKRFFGSRDPVGRRLALRIRVTRRRSWVSSATEAERARRGRSARVLLAGICRC